MSLVLLAGCDSQPDGGLDIGEFRGTVADVRASGAVWHDASDADAALASTFSIQMDLSVEDGESVYRPVYVRVRVPLRTPVKAADYDVAADAVAEIVEYRDDVPVVLETASAGSIGLFQPEHQDQDGFRISGVVDIVFPSGTVAGSFRAVARGFRPESGCDRWGCVDH